MHVLGGQPRAERVSIAFVRLLTRLKQLRPEPVARSMLCWFLSALVLLMASFSAEAECVDPAMRAHASVSITRIFDSKDTIADPNLLSISGTAWFLTARAIVTVAHVAEAMHLSAQDWKDIEVRDGDNGQSIPVRLSRLVGAHSEKIAVLELGTPFPGAQFLRIRAEPLAADERLMSIAYPHGRLRVADGRFVNYGVDDRFAGAALLELYDGDDRLVLDHGASGAPVLDCQG